MYLRQFYDPSLAQASYLIGCQATGDAIVVDPTRDVQPYLSAAASEGLRITHVTETHIHADFVSGSRELAAASGATMYLSAEGGPEWQYAFAVEDGARLLRDGDRIHVGNVLLEVMHTPGHTIDGMSLVVTDKRRGAEPWFVLTGDTLFVGAVGRPDLAGREREMAGILFDTLRYRILTLPDTLEIFPGHQAGSVCGAGLSGKPSSTLGFEKRWNPALAIDDREKFIEYVVREIPVRPANMDQIVAANSAG